MPVLRTVKNIVKNHTDAEVKVREATSNDPWGPSSTLMAEIADLTYNVVAFTEIMSMIWKRLNDHGKNWRHVYKSLALLEYIIKTGSEKVGHQCKENIFVIQTLRDFQHIEDNKDLGANVREKAKALVALLKDDERLKNERAKALKAKERFAENFGIGSDQSQTQLGRPRHRTDHAVPVATTTNSELEQARPSSAGEEEMQLQLALAMSKEEADSEAKKRTNDELKLQLALEESKKEDEVNEQRRRRQLNDFSLLDLASGSSQPTNDPWSATTTQPAVTVEPWSSSQPTTTVNTASPFSPLPSSSASNDPWAVSSSNGAAAPAASTAAANPWDSPPAASSAVSNDPWLTTAPPAANPPNGNAGHKPISSTLDDDFESLGMRPSPASQPPPLAASQGDALFSIGLMGNDLPSSQPATKKPEDFLDPTAKNLVNLDSLVTKPKSPAGVVNPFAMTSQGTGSTAAGATNPFLAQQPVQPSLNQMSASHSLQGFPATQPTISPMMNPMMPTSQPPGMYPGYPTQNPAQSNNPFL